MESDIAKKVAARFEELPELVQNAIKSADFDQKMQGVVQRHQLHIDQAGALGDETLMVMMGFTPPAEFAESIEKQLNVSKAQSEAIAQDVSDSLFIPIREAMQEFLENKALLQTIVSEKPNAQKPSAPVAPAAPTPMAAPTPPPPAQAAPAVPAVAPTLIPSTSSGQVAPAKPVDMPAEVMLNEKTASVPKKDEPPGGAPYKADPYREPV